MSYPFYKVLHLFGIFMVLMSLGGIALHMANGGARQFMNRKWIGMLHGVGLLIALIGGFGLLARLGLTKGFPSWIWGKLAIWLFLGFVPALFYRRPQMAKTLWLAVFVLAVVSASLAVYKP